MSSLVKRRPFIARMLAPLLASVQFGMPNSARPVAAVRRTVRGCTARRRGALRTGYTVDEAVSGRLRR